MEGTFDEDVKGEIPDEPPVETQDDKRNSPPPRHKLSRQIKGLQTSYNPISLEDILHARILPVEFIFNAHDESYPEEAPKIINV